MSEPKIYGFYRPHRQVSFDGRVPDPETGELVYQPSMTKQSFVKECDINNILKEFRVTGQIRHMSAHAAAGAYEDLPEPADFQESLHHIMAANEAFATLPSQVRRRFDNDPAEFLKFMADPANQDEAIKMGLAKDNRPPPPPPAPPPAGDKSASADANPGGGGSAPA